MEPTSMQKTKEDLAFKAGEVRQAARDLNETDPTATAPAGSETAHPTLGERLREGYEEAKDSVSYAAKDLKEKMSLHPQTTQPSTATTGSAFGESSSSSYPSGAATTSTAYPPSSTVATEEEMHKPSLTERLRETYEGAKDTVMEKAHDLREKIAPSSDPVAVNATASTELGAPRVGATTSTADVPDAPHGTKITTPTTDLGTTHTFGERVRDSVRETTHNVKEKLENLTGMTGEEEAAAATTTTAPAPVSTRSDYETTSSNAPDYTYSSVGTSATHPDYTQKAKDAYHDTANTSADKYHEMKNTAADKYHEIKNAAADKYHETKNVASDYAQSAKNKASEYAEEAREKMEEWKQQPSSTTAEEEKNLAAGSQAQKYVTSTGPGSVTTTTTIKQQQEPKP